MTPKDGIVTLFVHIADIILYVFVLVADNLCSKNRI